MVVVETRLRSRQSVALTCVYFLAVANEETCRYYSAVLLLFLLPVCAMSTRQKRRQHACTTVFILNGIIVRVVLCPQLLVKTGGALGVRYHSAAII